MANMLVEINEYKAIYKINKANKISFSICAHIKTGQLM